jgi:dihydroneopterin aldolase/2-amino-4-hydroxy-6-hydroxymethyldihydropteridine diphosphokinase
MPKKKSQGKILTAYIGVGSNIAPGENIPKALELLAHSTQVVATSTFFRTSPLESRRQPEYRNGVWRIETEHPPRVLKYEILKNIEKTLKRVRTKDKYAARTIDLDLLIYGNTVSTEKGFEIPDPDLYRRRFIAAGLFELNPRLRLPDTKEGIKRVLTRLGGEPLVPDAELTNRLRAMLVESACGDEKQAQLWRLEYETLRGINLSFTDDSEPVPVSLFRSLIEDKIIERPGKILDIGCGKGRVGLHLAQAGFDVTGFDIVPSAVSEFHRIAGEKGLAGKVKTLVGDINRRWEMPDQFYDCAFAITVVDNLLTRPTQMHFIRELVRVLSPDGILVMEFYGETDGYYGKLLRKAGKKSGIVIDPNNKMRFRIYTDHELLDLFSPHFSLIRREKAVWMGSKYRRCYKRASNIWILKRV